MDSSTSRAAEPRVVDQPIGVGERGHDAGAEHAVPVEEREDVRLGIGHDLDGSGSATVVDGGDIPRLRRSSPREIE